MSTLEAAIDAGEALTKDSFQASVWSRLDCKDRYLIAQCGRCGYCESRLRGHPVHIDHVAPKLQVADLDEPGSEDPATGRMATPRTTMNPRVGYWWRAYDWSNHLAACFSCNTRWKRTLYPLASGPRTADPARGVAESPLLLDPFVKPETDADPSRHLRYDDRSGVPGQVQGATPRGAATVEVCGLDRPTLVDARSRTARNALDLIDSLYEDGDQRELLRKLLALGAPNRDFAGLVRALWWHAFELPWSALEKLAAA